jgi:hypothetical protein
VPQGRRLQEQQVPQGLRLQEQQAGWRLPVPRELPEPRRLWRAEQELKYSQRALPLRQVKQWKKGLELLSRLSQVLL